MCALLHYEVGQYFQLGEHLVFYERSQHMVNQYYEISLSNPIMHFVTKLSPAREAKHTLDGSLIHHRQYLGGWSVLESRSSEAAGLSPDVSH